ncbi:TatD family hydrolase [Paludibacterium sp.]|uniref:TatD family hydrolase n=2 Tax=Paludibacterium sp. TaxID=1917523 RepID=UPI0025EFE198|nr:TatD family hydrolase [Paludibacterium sp.]MBV8647052.1 TatD family hydrolase [Paludibacterium sp.]
MQHTSLLIDTHCHLDADEFASQRDQAVTAALAAGVGQIVVPAVAARLFAACLAMRARYGCLIAFGLHPLYCAEHVDDHLTALETRLRQDQPVAVGEIGLDAWLPDADLARQETLFVEQLKLARRFDLPVILHLRRAQDRVLKYLRQIPVAGGIAHAFNGSEQQAQAFIALGFKLGFGGAMTYTGSQRIRRLAATLPLDSLVLETDAPDIRPAWASDVPNQPANLARFAAELASLRQLPLAEVCRQTTANARQALAINDTSLGQLHAARDPQLPYA